MSALTGFGRVASSATRAFLSKDRGIQALIVTNLLGNLLRLLSNLVLARLLSPEAFAITGLAAAVIFAFDMMSDCGFRAFILKHAKGGEISILKTLWTIRLIRNACLALLLFLFSETIASFFAIDDLLNVLPVLCLVFLVDGFVPIGFIAIERENKIAKIMYVRFLCSVLATIFMVFGVFLYENYWPMILSMILNPLLQIILGYFLIGGRGTGFLLDKSVSVEFYHWAKYIIPSSILTLFLVQFDKVILGKVLSVSELGLYFIAFNFSSAAAAFAIEYVRGVLQPYFSQVYRESPTSYTSKIYQKKQNFSLLLAFGLGGLSGVAYLFFDILYPDEYISAGFYLSLLLIMPIMALVTYPAEISLILHGYIKTPLIINMIRIVWFCVGSLLSFFWFGPLGILVTIASVEVFPGLYMMRKLLPLKAIRLISEGLVLISALLGFCLSKALIYFSEYLIQ